jgi:hypothetical protein
MLDDADVKKLAKAFRRALPTPAPVPAKPDAVRRWWFRFLHKMCETGREIGLLWITFAILDAAIAALLEKPEIAPQLQEMAWEWSLYGAALVLGCGGLEALLSE